MLDQSIDALDILRVVVPLPTRLRVWGNAITAREFVVVRAHAGGWVGTGYALARGMDIGRVVERQIKPQVIGQPVGAIRYIWNKLRASARMTGDTGLFARALSVVDIALWDVLGKLMNAPLWRVWGGAAASTSAATSVPCVAICGYYRFEDSVQALRDEAERLVAAGYRRFKIPFGEDLALDVQRVRALREVVGPDAQIGLDASGTFNTIKEALAAWRPVESFGIDFLEDPFAAPQWELAMQLARVAPVKIAFGESITTPQIIQHIGAANGLDIVRPDATVQHGITGFLQGVAPALENQLSIFPHYYPDIHAPLAAGLGLTMIEESPGEADTVGFGVLRARQPVIERGEWQMTEAAGLGIDWDEDALRRFSAGA